MLLEVIRGQGYGLSNFFRSNGGFGGHEKRRGWEKKKDAKNEE